MKFKVGDKVLYENKKNIVGEVYEYGYRITDDEGYSCFATESELESIKPTISELRDYMLEHFVNVLGHLDIGGLDFSEFDGSVVISGMKVKGDLYQIGHKVERHLYQSWHEVQGDLYQSKHKVKGDYNCEGIEYGGNAYVDEPKKTLKEITKEELAEMGYKLKG